MDLSPIVGTHKPTFTVHTFRSPVGEIKLTVSMQVLRLNDDESFVRPFETLPTIERHECCACKEKLEQELVLAAEKLEGFAAPDPVEMAALRKELSNVKADLAKTIVDHAM